MYFRGLSAGQTLTATVKASDHVDLLASFKPGASRYSMLHTNILCNRAPQSAPETFNVAISGTYYVHVKTSSGVTYKLSFTQGDSESSSRNATDIPGTPFTFGDTRHLVLDGEPCQNMSSRLTSTPGRRSIATVKASDHGSTCSLFNPGALSVSMPQYRISSAIGNHRVHRRLFQCHGPGTYYVSTSRPAFPGSPTSLSFGYRLELATPSATRICPSTQTVIPGPTA